MSTPILHRPGLLAAAVLAAGLAVPLPAVAQLNLGQVMNRTLQFSAPPGRTLGAPDIPMRRDMRVAQADCSSAAAQAAAESGGQVLSVSSRQQGGRTVCVVTVLVPGADGERPRKRTITIPQ